MSSSSKVMPIFTNPTAAINNYRVFVSIPESYDPMLTPENIAEHLVCAKIDYGPPDRVHKEYEAEYEKHLKNGNLTTLPFLRKKVVYEEDEANACLAIHYIIDMCWHGVNFSFNDKADVPIVCQYIRNYICSAENTMGGKRELPEYAELNDYLDRCRKALRVLTNIETRVINNEVHNGTRSPKKLTYKEILSKMV